MEFGERTPQLIQIDKQNFYAGGEVQFVGPGVTFVDNDFSDGMFILEKLILYI